MKFSRFLQNSEEYSNSSLKRFAVSTIYSDFVKNGNSLGLIKVDSEKIFSAGGVPVGTSTTEKSFLGKFGKARDWQFLRKSS